MKVSTRVEYGLLALTDIALYAENGTSVSAPEIAERQNISQKYLEQILIRAQKGLRGGYALTRPADMIKLPEILNALDNSILEEMSIAENEDDHSLRGVVNASLWKGLNRSINAFAESRTLSDIIQECRERMSNDWAMNIICFTV